MREREKDNKQVIDVAQSVQSQHHKYEKSVLAGGRIICSIYLPCPTHGAARFSHLPMIAQSGVRGNLQCAVRHRLSVAVPFSRCISRLTENAFRRALKSRHFPGTILRDYMLFQTFSITFPARPLTKCPSEPKWEYGRNMSGKFPASQRLCSWWHETARNEETSTVMHVVTLIINADLLYKI